MAAIEQKAEEVKPETKISSEWGPFLDPKPPATTLSQQDSSGRPLPEGAMMIHQLFSIREAETLVAKSEEAAGYGFTNYPKEYRGNLRLTAVDQSLADAVWKRLQAFVPATLELGGTHYDAVGLNECWRLAKYGPGDRFGENLVQRLLPLVVPPIDPRSTLSSQPPTTTRRSIAHRTSSACTR